MRTHVRKFLKQLLIVGACSAFLLPTFASAAIPFTVTPAVIDGEAKAREIVRYKVTITNTESHLVSIYPWARDLDQGGEVTNHEGVDPSESLLAWTEFSRGVIDIPAKGSVELPILIQVNLRAKPGVYHEVLHLSEGPNRPEAELNTAGTISLTINIRVPDDANEQLQLGAFSTDKNMFTGDTASFGYRLANTGNRGIVPGGKIRIFDRTGEEVDTIELNREASKIEPDATELLGAVWQSGDHFGKYKAMLDVSYGKTGAIQDTVFFWVLPWKRLLSMFLTLALLCVIASLMFHSYNASGGRKLAVVRAKLFPEGNTDGDDSKSLLTGIRERLHEQFVKKVGEYYQAGMPLIEPLVEVDPPPPSRTRYSVSSGGGVAPVKLEHRKRAVPHPAHIVRLK